MYTVMLMTNNSGELYRVPTIMFDQSNNPFIAETIEQAKGFIDYCRTYWPNETYQIFKLSTIDLNKELS